MIAHALLPDLFAGMNKTERRRAIELEALRRDGQIHSWAYEKVTLKLADDTRYTPDLMVIENDGAIRFEEIKGFWREDAKIKIKVAAQQFPFRFVSLVASRDGWERTDFTSPQE